MHELWGKGLAFRLTSEGRATVTCCGDVLREHLLEDGWQCDHCHTYYDARELIELVNATIVSLKDLSSFFQEMLCHDSAIEPDIPSGGPGYTIRNISA